MNKILQSTSRQALRDFPQRFRQWTKHPDVWGFLLSIVVLIIISLAFFAPDNFDGNSLAQADMLQGAANGHEAQTYEQQTGEKALWTNALFSGMPTFQISPTYPSNSLFTWLNSVYGLGLPAPSNLLFMMMFGFLILMACLRQRWYYGLIGAVAWGLSSYFIIIIGAGHIWKFMALTYVPPTIGAVIMIYNGRRLTGAAIMALFMMLELNANHPQITYYFAWLMIILAVAYLVAAIVRHTMKKWIASSLVALAAAVLALGANLPSIYNTYEYSKQTKRAASELTPLPSAASSATSEERPTGGLPKSEIGGWSNLPEESFSLLIPNIKGGATIKPEKGKLLPLTLEQNKHFDYRMAASEPTIQTPEGQVGSYPIFSNMTEYFGGKDLTNGPFYVGALIFALFILGCFVVRGPVKWTLLGATVISVLVAMGNHFPLLTDFLIYNVPLYNKFRAAETALVVAALCMPLMAMLALRELFTTEHPFRQLRFQLGLSVAFVFPIFICFIAYVDPSLFGTALTPHEAEMLTNLPAKFDEAGYIYDPAQIQATIDNVQNLRYAIVSDDAWRSLIILILGAIFIFLGLRGKIKSWMAVSAVGIIVLVDLFSVDKRYVDSDSFLSSGLYSLDIQPTKADQQILQDTSYYRVADLQGFREARSSYFHHTIGGYHAAKLNRYNDLLERQLYGSLETIYKKAADDILDSIAPSGAPWNIISMLNTKYIILPGENGGDFVYQNRQALGPAWLVDTIAYVENADAEMAALTALQPENVAVADKQFRQLLGDQIVGRQQNDYIRLVSYTPNRLTYTADTRNGGLAVFSEVWFPWGWHATIDGKEAELGRVNYVLRALRLPAGKHTVVMTFDPQSIHVTSSIAYIAITLIYMLCLIAIFFAFTQNHATQPDTEKK